jgi:predicted enzyme related to lactoylglutathione lyase
MSATHGKFVWYELAAPDVAAAEAFYKSVIGWGAHDPHHSNHPYTMFTAGEAGVAGAWQITEEVIAMGGRAGWRGYIQVDDIAASAAAVIAAGGKIVKPASEIPNVGLFAVAVDPQGAAFHLLQMAKPMEPNSQSAAGHVGWHELYTADYAADFEFYAAVFGWTKSDAIDMGPMGMYQMFVTNGGNVVGGMMNKPDPAMPSGWKFYVNVDAIDAAVARLETGGGMVVHGPQRVPDGAWIVQAIDPQGVMFAVVAPVK